MDPMVMENLTTRERMVLNGSGSVIRSAIAMHLLSTDQQGTRREQASILHVRVHDKVHMNQFGCDVEGRNGGNDHVGL